MKASRALALALLGCCALAASPTALAANEQKSTQVRQYQAPITDATVVPECALIKCSDQGAGVCGSDGKTYANPCQLTSAKCSNPGLTLVSEGPCPTTAPSAATPVVTPASPASSDKCARACPRIYKPVCDSLGAVYSNECAFKQAKCATPSLKRGNCPKPAKCELPQCAPIEKPVCASNGKTYMNPCLFSYVQCKDPSLFVQFDGECAPAQQGGGGDGTTPSDTTAAACMALTCREFSKCLVDERTGQGYCADICDPKRCAATKKCVLKQVQCFTTPCPPVAECVTAA